MKYDDKLSEVVKLLPNSANILVALPSQVGIDELAAGLTLFLSLSQSGKNVSIVTEGVIKVGQSHLFGVGQIQNSIPGVASGDFIISLGGVVAPDGTIPAVEKMDYFPTGTDLSLVFRVKPGQKFEPSHITPRYEGGNFNLIFVVGAPTLTSLGSIYHNQPQLFSGSHLVNIDNKPSNAQFGTTNIIDSQAASLSQIVAQILPSLNLPLDQDTATNLLTGIFEATGNLQSTSVNAETYEAVALAIRAGGQKPSLAKPASPAGGASEGMSHNEPVISSQPSPGFDLSKIFQAPINQPVDNFTVPPVVGTASTSQPSPEEVPQGEVTVTPEDDWLTPKIYKGKGAIG